MKRHWMDFWLATTLIVLPISTAPARHNWTNNPGNPCWSDGTLVLEPAVLIDSVRAKYDLWYCGDDYSQAWKIGLATSAPGAPQETFWHQTGGPIAAQDIRYITSNSQGTIFAGTWTAGEVYKSTNNGDTWTACGAIPNANPILGLTIDQHDHIFASVFLRGIALSTDNGATWQMKNNGLTNFAVRWSVLDKQDNVWVASEGGIFRTTNDGESWTNMKAGQFYNVWLDSLGAVVTQESDGTFDNLGNTNNYLYRSTDGGTTWSSTYIPGKGIAGVHADGSYYGNSYVGSNIYRSTDLGATWTDLHVPVSWNGYTTFTGFPSNGDVFFTMNGDAAGVLRSTDNGATWVVTNSGLTNLRVTCIYPHPDGYIFLGTGFTGVCRSSQSLAPPQDVTVSLPNLATAAGNEVEIPVNVTSLSGWGILSYEFTLTFNDPQGILSLEATPITGGTLLASNGWSVQINATEPNKVTVGAYGATPLYGNGVLLKLKARAAQAAAAGDSTGLVLTRFVFNSGTPQPAIINGGIAIRERVCGDADESGSVQAYDAALTLREAMGPMSPPPPPLTAVGRLNADVNQDGKVQAYDAALILRHVIGLSVPESTASCFGPGGVSGSSTSLALSGKVLGIEHGTDHTAMLVGLTNVPAELRVYSYSFELTCSPSAGDTMDLTLPTLNENYMATVNRLGDGHFKVGIINPYGVDVNGIYLTLAAKFASSLNQITISGLMLNDVPNETIILRNNINSVEPNQETRAQAFDLMGAYPNPFNPSTRIVFQTPVSGLVRLEVYNLQGIRIKTLRDEQMASGQHEIFWDGTNNLGHAVATGEYFCLMRSGSFVKTLRLLLLK